jgi:hypothetical protein
MRLVVSGHVAELGSARPLAQPLFLEQRDEDARQQYAV